MKMCEFVTAEYSDGRTLYEQTIEQAYAYRNGESVTMKPTIWLWGGSGVYFVDYVGRSVGCTLGCFDDLNKAQQFREKLEQMEKDDFCAWFLSDGNKWVVD